MAKAFVTIGAELGKLPDDAAIKKIIPARTSIERNIKKTYEIQEKQLILHLKEIDDEIYPGFHLSFDLWSDRGKKHHYLGVIAHEADLQT